MTMKINIPSPTSPTTLNVPATAPVLLKNPLLELELATLVVDEGVDRMTVVTTIVLPLETERNVDGDSEGVGVRLGGEVEVEEEEDVEDGGRVEVDEVEDSSEVDGGRDVELSPEVVVGGGVTDGVSPGVETVVELP